MGVAHGQPGDDERMHWQSVPHSLEHRVVSLDELKKLFPKTDRYGEISIIKQSLDSRYYVYGQRLHDSGRHYGQYLAYQCPSCKEIVTGPPNIVDDNSIEEGIPMADRKGYDVYCTNCNYKLDECTLEMS